MSGFWSEVSSLGCLAADSRMEVQYEDETTPGEVDSEIMGAWNQHVSSLVKMFRLAEDPCPIAVGDGVRKLSRTYYNETVDQIRSTLSDISSFAIRWAERAWEIALNLHAGHHGVECYREPLDSKTFADAIRISRFFSDRQLEVLQRPRIKAINERRDRLVQILSDPSCPQALLGASLPIAYPDVFHSASGKSPFGCGGRHRSTLPLGFTIRKAFCWRRKMDAGLLPQRLQLIKPQAK